MTEDEAKIAALKFGIDMAKATRRATIEECAKIADSYEQNAREQGATPQANAFEMLAKSIRSLTKAGKGE